MSRSSALASKATGFPIAKIAAKLAVGYRLDELRNDITRETPACFEPTIDYVVTKGPRWNFDKFPDADPTLTTQMKSVGETMAIGRTFKESLQKALRGLETGRFGFGSDRQDYWGTPRQPSMEEIYAKLATPTPDRIWFLHDAFKAGMSIEDIYLRTRIDRWFLANLQEIVACEDRLRACPSLSRRRQGVDFRGQTIRLSAIARLGAHLAHQRNRSGSHALRNASGGGPCSSSWTPAPRNSKRSRLTTTRRTKRR